MRKNRLIGTAVACTVVTTCTLTAYVASPTSETGALPYSATTSVGVHNAYENNTFEYFADALDSGAGLLGLDVWTNFLGSGWRVSHNNPLGNNSNCVNAASSGELRAKPRDQGLAGCLADIRSWHHENPDHPPIQLKREMKDGFADNLGRGPAALDALDALVNEYLGDAVYRPAELTGEHPTLDAAVRADGWPSRDELAGRFIIHLIPGTVEENNPFDQLWADEEYATHLRDLSESGALGLAVAFPAVHHAESGDPRTARYPDASLRPWFVVFDGDASTYVQQDIDTSWYADRHYLLIMTSAHAVPPATDPRHPSEEEALTRVSELAERYAGVVTSDWAALPSVLATVLPHG